MTTNCCETSGIGTECTSFEEELNQMTIKLREMHEKESDKCPNCGYCPCCGRKNKKDKPRDQWIWPYQPYSPWEVKPDWTYRPDYYPYHQPYTTCTGNATFPSRGHYHN